MADLTQKVHGLYTDWVLLFFTIFSKLKKVNFFSNFMVISSFWNSAEFPHVPVLAHMVHGLGAVISYFLDYDKSVNTKNACSVYICISGSIRLVDACASFPFSVSFGCITIPAWLLPMFKALIKTICLLLSD